jgi:hypothetical protein
MKAKLLHHAWEWLPGKFQAPGPLARKKHLTAWRAHQSPTGGLIGMKLVGAGTGVWDTAGKLLRYAERGADLAWREGPTDLLSLEAEFGRCGRRKGIRHALKRLEAGSFRVLDEAEVCVPTGGVEYLVVNHGGDRCLATWLDQTEWGYVLMDLARMAQLPGEFAWPSPTLAPPAFSPNDALVVSCNFFRSGWWTDEVDDYWDVPSPGGLRKAGTITVQTVASGKMTRHDVLVDLPPGWMPDRPDRPEWDQLWGPEFVSERGLRIWLPDESDELLSLPLPRQIEICRGIQNRRPPSSYR